MSEKILIVGGGVAGGSVAVSLSVQGFDVTLISSDPVVYSKMTLSYALKNRVLRIDPYVTYYPEDLKSLGVKFINDTVVQVDPSRRVVKTESGRVLEYDILILATGSRANMPKIEGLGLEGVHMFLSFEDMVRLDQDIEPGRRAVVVGSGMIGMLVADALHSRGLDVTLVDILPYPLLTVVEEPIARVMLRRVESRGVRFLGGVSVERLEGDRRVRRVILSNGDKIPADIVVMSTGVTAAVPEGLESLREGPGGSVLTDKYFRTKIPGVYAIGDCASSIDYVTSRTVYRPLGILASYEARLLPRALRGLGYSGFIPYQIEEAFGYYFIRLGLNSFESKRLGVSYSIALAEFRVPGLGVSKSIVLYERGSDRVIGWQNIGSIMTSYKSKIFEEAIRSGEKLGDLQEKKIKIIEID
ncbi:MAG: NAD(P)/FAD-dependent oxidoreductase [Sulfolobales archaeon]